MLTVAYSRAVRPNTKKPCLCASARASSSATNDDRMPPRKRARSSSSSSDTSFLIDAAGAGADDALRTSISTMWEQRKMCDVIVMVGDREFHAHRLVLAAESAFFKALLAGDFVEAGAAKVTIADITPATFELVLEFMYRRVCRLPTQGELQPLLEAACRLQVPSLQAAAEANLIARLTPANAVQCLSFADHLCLVELARAAEDVMLQEFEAIEPSALKELSASQLGALLAADALHIEREEKAFEALAAWHASQEPPPEDGVTRSLLCHVRFPLMASHYVKETVESHPLVLAHPMVFATAFREAYGQEATPRTRTRTRTRRGDWQTLTPSELKDGKVVQLIEDVNAAARSFHRVSISSASPAALASLVGVNFELISTSNISFKLRHPEGSTHTCTRQMGFCLCTWGYNKEQAFAFVCQPSRP